MSARTPDRYSRQRLLGGIGESGQQALASSSVVLVGCGALGTHIAQHLARAGVGSLRLVDRDFVELDNLQRQVLYDERDAHERLPKAEAAARRLTAINGEIAISGVVADLTAENVRDLFDGADLVIDGTDNFTTRYLINDACLEADRPWIYGGCVSTHGMVLVVRPGVSACFACLVPEAPAPGSTPTCDTAGVLGPAVGVVAALQSGEAIKLLAGREEALLDGLLTIDVWSHQYRVLTVPRVPHCRACGQRRFDSLDFRAAGGAATTLCGRNAVQVTPRTQAALDLEQVAGRLEPLGTVRRHEFLLVFRHEGLEATLFADGRAVVKGTDDPTVARAFYDRFIGS